MALMHRIAGATTALVLVASVGSAEQRAARAVTSADYAQAEKFMAYNTAPLVLHAGVRPTWLPDGRFWYRVTTEKGSEAILVDPATLTLSLIHI